MYYPFFLFTQLHKDIINSQKEYDDLFADVVALYDSFLRSDYNVPTKSQYDCMVSFLENAKLKPNKTVADLRSDLLRYFDQDSLITFIDTPESITLLEVMPDGGIVIKIPKLLNY